MNRNSSLFHRVRYVFSDLGGRGAARELAIDHRAAVDRYLIAADQSTSGFDVYVGTLEKMRDLATTALVALQAEAEKKMDYKTERFVAIASGYMRELERPVLGNEAKIAQLRIDYEEAKRSFE